MTTEQLHPDAVAIYRHRWHDRRGYPPETRSETIVRLYRAEKLNTESGDLGVAKAARDERLRLLGKGGKA